MHPHDLTPREACLLVLMALNATRETVVGGRVGVAVRQQTHVLWSRANEEGYWTEDSQRQKAKDDPRIAVKMLLCLACVDYSDYFQLVYVLQSLDPERTLALRTDVPYSDATVPSVTPVWRAADWYEREAHDLFGVSFDGHPDLAPLLLYEGFEGFPGRKEFPFNEYQEF